MTSPGDLRTLTKAVDVGLLPRKTPAATKTFVAPSFNGRTVGSEPINRGSNPWGATNPAVIRTARDIDRLRRFLGSRQIDLIHANSLKSDLLSGIAGKLSGIPVLWHVRDRISDDYLPGAVVRLFSRAARYLPTAILTNSRATAATLEGAAGTSKRLFVVHAGTDVETFREQKTKTTTRSPGEVSIGRISPWKGQEVFLRAARQLRSKYPSARFKLIGAALFDEKEYEAGLHRLADELDLNDLVEFKGFCSDVPSEIAQLDVVVHASIKAEPFGQVIIEGMAAGKAVVATAAGGVLEIVEDGVTGLLVPMGNEAALAEAIGSLLCNEELRQRLGAAAQRHVTEHFSIQKTAAEVLGVYEAIFTKADTNSAVALLKQHSGEPLDAGVRVTNASTSQRAIPLSPDTEELLSNTASVRSPGL